MRPTKRNSPSQGVSDRAEDCVPQGVLRWRTVPPGYSILSEIQEYGPRFSRFCSYRSSAVLADPKSRCKRPCRGLRGAKDVCVVNGASWIMGEIQEYNSQVPVFAALPGDIALPRYTPPPPPPSIATTTKKRKQVPATPVPAKAKPPKKRDKVSRTAAARRQACSQPGGWPIAR
ncbi:uncharacterized protein LOC112465286 [Temnothorax curvispinosus]|uniref:Uncharacterized protein LOC112462704 n=1 Tax=Temnothorax curvispinosus TaxID=300111 RepID=A0A6J1QPG6_9HYME|nr:uncharacterized protein LOC112462704 [Temnothorax curvispinosus]XP_024888536.1 uncharacterized protein LOC112465286 [Temnothorax curvispinosus]